jgi:hypothetical protein
LPAGEVDAVARHAVVQLTSLIRSDVMLSTQATRG